MRILEQGSRNESPSLRNEPRRGPAPTGGRGDQRSCDQLNIPAGRFILEDNSSKNAHFNDPVGLYRQCAASNTNRDRCKFPTFSSLGDHRNKRCEFFYAQITLLHNT